MNKNLFFLFFFTYFLSYSQQRFTYQFYVDETVREGVLFYNYLENKALYLDKVTQTKRVTNDGQIDEDVTIATFSGDIDSFIFKDENIVVFTQDLLKTKFLVKDELPQIYWELTSEKKEIQNLICYKATTKFRGRNWTVWYCPEIPITYGPWKFYGLPGLIVEAKDDSDRFVFNLASYILKSHEKEPKVDTSGFKKVSMKQMAENISETFNNIPGILSSSKNENGGFTVSSTQVKKGIESKYEWEE